MINKRWVAGAETECNRPSSRLFKPLPPSSSHATRNAPTPWISSWMTSVLLEGVCHSRSTLVGTGEVVVAIFSVVRSVVLTTFKDEC